MASAPRADEPLEGLLRRRLVSDNTLKIYQPLVKKLQRDYNLSDDSTVNVIDRAVDQELVLYFIANKGISQARHLFYATRHHYTQTNASLRLSYASLRAYGRRRRTKRIP